MNFISSALIKSVSVMFIGYLPWYSKYEALFTEKAEGF